MKYLKFWENKYQPRILYSAKLCFKTEGEIKNTKAVQWVREWFLQQMVLGRQQKNEIRPLIHTTQAYLILLHFALLGFTDTGLFTNWRFVATLHQSSLLAPFFSTACAHFVSLYHVLVILAIFQTFSLLLYVMVINDQWPLMLLLQKDYDLLKAQMIIFFSNKVFQVMVCTLFF